jgi:hypothetical protein
MNRNPFTRRRTPPPERMAAAKTLRTWLALHDLGHDGPVPCTAHDEGQRCCVDKEDPNQPNYVTQPNPIRLALDTLLKEEGS